jgi:hypothetical protein
MIMPKKELTLKLDLRHIDILAENLLLLCIEDFYALEDYYNDSLDKWNNDSLDKWNNDHAPRIVSAVNILSQIKSYYPDIQQFFDKRFSGIWKILKIVEEGKSKFTNEFIEDEIYIHWEEYSPPKKPLDWTKIKKLPEKNIVLKLDDSQAELILELIKYDASDDRNDLVTDVGKQVEYMHQLNEARKAGKKLPKNKDPNWVAYVSSWCDIYIQMKPYFPHLYK